MPTRIKILFVGSLVFGLSGISCTRKNSLVLPISQIPLSEVIPAFASYYPSVTPRGRERQVFVANHTILQSQSNAQEILSIQAQTDSGMKLGLSMSVSLGHSLSPENPLDSMTFEPAATLTFQGSNALSLAGAIDRPLNPYENFSIPKTSLTYSHPISVVSTIKSQLRATSALLELDRWSSDGVMLRNGVAAQISYEFLPNLSFVARAGPFVQVNEYTQRTSGASLTQYGFSERFGATYQASPISFNLLLVTEQKFASVWNNDYYTYESMSYQLSSVFTAGLSHELSSGFVEKSTGFYRPVRLFDGRDSRVSIFMELSI